MTTINSMTGFGRAENTSELGALTMEIKTVNHRFLDSRLHFPRDLGWLEIPLMKTIKKRLKRGKLEISIRWTPAESNISRARFNEPLLAAYSEELDSIANALGRDDRVSFDHLLSLPGVSEKESPRLDSDQMLELASATLNEALDALQIERAREGAALANELTERLNRLDALRSAIATRAPEVVNAYRARLDKKAAEWARAADIELEKARLETEILLMAERADIREELVRLDAHVAAFRQTLDAPNGKSQGKPMEFLTQELLRETNTIASKARDTDILSSTLEMKNEIEKIREQIMNVE